MHGLHDICPYCGFELQDNEDHFHVIDTLLGGRRIVGNRSLSLEEAVMV